MTIAWDCFDRTSNPLPSANHPPQVLTALKHKASQPNSLLISPTTTSLATPLIRAPLNSTMSSPLTLVPQTPAIQKNLPSKTTPLQDPTSPTLAPASAMHSTRSFAITSDKASLTSLAIADPLPTLTLTPNHAPSIGGFFMASANQADGGLISSCGITNSVVGKRSG